MNKILNEITKIINDNIALYLPHVAVSGLEKNGAVFYMNGKDGTEFEWYVNDKLPPFMVFYDDKDNLGAVKFLLYSDGKVQVYLYDENGKKFIQRVDTNVVASKGDILALAVVLRNQADDKSIWDADIEAINTDIEINKDRLKEFESRQNQYTSMRNKKNILNLNAYVSKKIIEEGWKVGYMDRNKPFNDMDSGWFFAVGNEEDNYFSDSENIIQIAVGIVWQRFDSDIFTYIDMPIGTKLIRISSEKFEEDKGDKEIYVIKR